MEIKKNNTDLKAKVSNNKRARLNNQVSKKALLSTNLIQSSIQQQCLFERYFKTDD